MGLPVKFKVNVTALPDNDVWFANSQAWTNYWRNIIGEATIEPATTDKYAATPYDYSLAPVGFNYLGIDYSVPSVAMFQKLLDRVNTLNTAFENMRTQLKDAGIITEAQ